MNPDDYRRLVAAGLTPDQVAVVMEVMQRNAEAVAEADEDRKAKARARWRKWKHGNNNANVSKREQTLANNSRDGDARVEDNLQTQRTDNRKKESKKRAERLCADWVLPFDWRQDAINAGLPEHLIDAEAANMRDWSLSSKNGAKLDWRATWRTWCRRRAGEIAQGRAGPPPPGPKPNSIQAAIERRRQKEIQNGLIGTDRRTDNVALLDFSRVSER